MALDPTAQPLKLRSSLPVAPLRGTVIFPSNNVPIVSGRLKSKTALDSAYATDRLIVFVTQKNDRIDDPTEHDLFQVGTVCLIRRIIKVDGEYQVSAEGLVRVYIKRYVQTEPFFVADIEEIPELYEKNEETEAMLRTVREQLRRYLELGGNPLFDPVGLSNISLLSANDDPNQLVNLVCQAIDFKTIDKQQILEMISAVDRLRRLSEILAKEVRILEISRKISSNTQERVSRMTKEAILREQMRSIEEELGESTENQEIREFELKIRKANMPKEVRAKANKELSRLAKMSSYNPEAGYIRNYLEWLTDLPWRVGKSAIINLKKASFVLDEDHYGLNKVKERILEYLAVHKLSGKVKGPIICFVGPPGTGKTSIGKSIARALNRKFVKMSLGGVRDEAEIRGFRRTYVGALPGRILQGITTAGTRNPVFMLDEVDKMGFDAFRGDPSAALLEALDPEQNNAFSDHYLEVPFDLSDVMFITTANILDPIPPALKDRMEVIEFPGYTEEEKFWIAQKFLVPKQMKDNGLTEKQIFFTEPALRTIIREYTLEAGVRELERTIAAVCRKVARKVAENGGAKAVRKIGIDDLRELLGPQKYRITLAEKKDEVGLVNGLAWTPAGGGVLLIEATKMPGKGQLILTGHLGQVMQES